MNGLRSGYLLSYLAMLTLIPEARAQFAVIDVASLAQLISQVRVLEEQVATARGQLTQAQAEFQSTTGPRRMEQLLNGTTRNYLPVSWTSLQSAALNGSGYPALTAAVRDALRLQSGLPDAQLAGLPPTSQAQLLSDRQSLALLQGLTRVALANSSNRFAALQQLIDAIPKAGDQKAILDLQARIAAEAGMLQNEHTKLEVLYQGMQADFTASNERLRELGMASHGQFANRFQPRP